MPSWNELLDGLQARPEPEQATWLRRESTKYLKEIGQLRGGRNVIFYASAFLQKPQAPADRLQITHEDLNALMSVMFGMDWQKGLTLVLHTPGGVTNAAETLVAYLRSKFTYIEVIVPTFAMSAGTMISLAAPVRARTARKEGWRLSPPRRRRSLERRLGHRCQRLWCEGLKHVEAVVNGKRGHRRCCHSRRGRERCTAPSRCLQKATKTMIS